MQKVFSPVNVSINVAVYLALQTFSRNYVCVINIKVLTYYNIKYFLKNLLIFFKNLPPFFKKSFKLF